MTPIPLPKLRLSPKHHLSALWWLGLLYRRPHEFAEACGELEWSEQIGKAALLLTHFLPYELLLTALGRLSLFDFLGLPTSGPVRLEDHLLVMALGIAGGIFFGIAGLVAGGISSGLAVGISLGIAGGMVGGLAGGITGGVAGGVVGGLALGTAFGIAFGLAGGVDFGIVFGISLGLAGAIAGVVAGGSILGIAFGSSFGAAFAVAFTRLQYYPIHTFLVWPLPNPALYRYHPVAWDDLCGARFFGLSALLVSYTQTVPLAGGAEIRRIIDTYPTQRFEALKASAILIAQKAANAKSMVHLAEITAELPGGEKGFLSQTSELKSKAAEIAAIQARLETMDRPFLRGPTTQLLVDRIETFRDQIAGFREPLASEFRAAATRWLKIAIAQRDRAQKVFEREPTAQVFRAGDPVDREKEAFVPRFPIFEALEAQVMLATGCPGILLYGRRRMGKSTVLKNLLGFLPPTVQVVSLSMQNPEASTSPDLLVQHIQRTITGQMPEARDDQPDEDLPGLFRFLSHLNSHLEHTGQRLLLGLDEYENLDRKIEQGVFPIDLLDTFRESIQSHRQITWVFAGSHSIDELPGAEWASYLVSARTVEVPPFTPEETRLLLTEPLKHSKLWRADDPARPRFSPEIWGERGIERIHEQAGGWPHLVQLVAETLVDRMNDAGKGSVDAELFERGLDAAVTAGDTVLSQLLRGESRVAGEWDYLLGFREHETQPPPDDGDARRSLQRRLVVVEADGGKWRLRAPLFGRWLRKRG